MKQQNSADPSPQASSEPHTAPQNEAELVQQIIDCKDLLTGIGYLNEFMRWKESRVTAPVGRPSECPNCHSQIQGTCSDKWHLQEDQRVASPPQIAQLQIDQAKLEADLKLLRDAGKAIVDPNTRFGYSPPQIAQPEQYARAIEQIVVDTTSAEESGCGHAYLRKAAEVVRSFKPVAQPSQVSAEQFWTEWWTAEKHDLQWNSWKGIAIKFANAYRAALAATPPQRNRGLGSLKLAVEYGYRACEKGQNLLEAVDAIDPNKLVEVTPTADRLQSSAREWLINNFVCCNCSDHKNPQRIKAFHESDDLGVYYTKSGKRMELHELLEAYASSSRAAKP